MPAREYRWRHLALLISILLLFVTAAFVVSLHDGILIMNVLSVIVLVAGSYALSKRKYLFAIAVVLSAITIAGTGLVLAFQQPWALLISSSSIVVLVAFSCVTILSYVLGSGRVTSDKIFAAICVYMLLGYGWTFVYSILLELQMGSFAATTEFGHSDYVGRMLQLRYFSFTTPDCRRIRRHRSALTGSTNHNNSGSGPGAVLSRGPGRTPGWFAHHARDRSTLACLIILPPKIRAAFEKLDCNC